jgi:endo-1,4-beta-xylanase
MQINAMRKYPDTFIEDEDLAKGNFHYLLAEGEVHAYEAVYSYLYNILPYLFQQN